MSPEDVTDEAVEIYERLWEEKCEGCVHDYPCKRCQAGEPLMTSKDQIAAAINAVIDPGLFDVPAMINYSDITHLARNPGGHAMSTDKTDATPQYRSCTACNGRGLQGSQLIAGDLCFRCMGTGRIPLVLPPTGATPEETPEAGGGEQWETFASDADGDGQWCIALAGGGLVIASVHAGLRNAAEQEADARLIAAAPDLLAELRAAIDLLDQWATKFSTRAEKGQVVIRRDPATQAAIERGAAAIAKATGGEP